jgi:hypothetical protein
LIKGIRINKLLRNKKFNFIGLTINLMKPWEKGNPNNQQSAMLIEFYNLVVDTPLFKSLYQANLATYDLEFRDMLLAGKEQSGAFTDAVNEFCHKIIHVFDNDD